LKPGTRGGLFEANDAVKVGAGEVLDDFAALHDEGYVLHDGDIGERVAFDGDEVGVVARFERADFVFLA
jgi:hypothetical protein